MSQFGFEDLICRFAITAILAYNKSHFKVGQTARDECSRWQVEFFSVTSCTAPGQPGPKKCDQPTKTGALLTR